MVDKSNPTAFPKSSLLDNADAVSDILCLSGAFEALTFHSPISSALRRLQCPLPTPLD